MSIPEKPANTDYFPLQHGYTEVHVKTHKYSDKPTPFAAKQSKANEFISGHTDRDHQKKYAKSLFNFLVNTLCK